MICPPRAMYPCFANWRLTASNTLSLAPALIKRSLNVQIVVRSGNLTGVDQARKAQEAHPVQQLEFHLLIRQVEQLQQQHNAHHHLGGERRPAAARPIRARCRPIYLGGKHRRIDMLVQYLQRVPNLFRFALPSWAANRLGFIMACTQLCCKNDIMPRLGFSRCSTLYTYVNGDGSVKAAGQKFLENGGRGGGVNIFVKKELI